MSQKLRFPEIPDIEFIDIIKNKIGIKTYKSKEVKGLSWREFQKLVGKDVGAGVYHYSMRVIGDPIQHSGSIRAVGQIPKEEKTNDSDLKNEIDSLKRKIENASQGTGIGIELLISVTKQSYETQISFLNNQIAAKDVFISKLESKIDELESDLDEANDIIDELKSKTGINQYLEIAQSMLKAKLGNTKPIQSLKDSDPNDIPKKILDLLGIVQWSEVEQKTIDTIVIYLNEFIPKLPLKGMI